MNREESERMTVDNFEDQFQKSNVVSIDSPAFDGRDAIDGPTQNRRTNVVNSYYHTKKSTAEGFMDLSLLSANANQLKFILFYNQESKTFYPALVLIVLSLILQVAVGILLIFRVSRVYR